MKALIDQMAEPSQHPAADTFAFGSVFGAGLAHLTQINEIVQIVAGLVAIVAGIMSVMIRWRGRKPKP
jgi:hypothetical protein